MSKNRDLQAIQKSFDRAKARYYEAIKKYPTLPFDLCKNDSGTIDWQKRVRDIEEKLPRLSWKVVAAAAQGQAYDHRRQIEDKVDLEHLLQVQAVFRKEFGKEPSSYNDSHLSWPTSLWAREGQIVSNALYWHLFQLYTCLRHAETPIKRVVEIGGGYGGLARLWLLYNPDIEYVDIDIPISTLYAETWLRANFPHLDDRVEFITINEVCASKDPHQYLLNADLVINAGSFQEQTDEAVTFWMSAIERADPKYFYSLNKLFNPMGIDSTSGNQCRICPVYDKWWDFLHLELDPEITTCDTTHRFLSAFAKRIPRHLRSSAERSFRASVYLEHARQIDAVNDERALRYWKAFWLDRSHNGLNPFIWFCKANNFSEYYAYLKLFKGELDKHNDSQ